MRTSTAPAPWPAAGTAREEAAPASGTEEKADELHGVRVGNFVVDRRLGSGGMAVVYRARHPSLPREVAVKFLASRYSSDPATAARFLQEARLTATLRHPNIVEIFDLGNVQGRPYYTMELLSGRTLAALMQKGGIMAPAKACDVLVQLARGLDAAHQRDVVHRDLKPDNVFVPSTEPLGVKIMDFGIAKCAFEGGEGLTQAGQILGTPTHLAPEQALGHAERISPRTDLYSLGVIAFELLSGRLPFTATTALELMVQHVKEPAPHLGTLAPSLPKGLCDLVARCLAKDPDERPASAREFAEQIPRALATESVEDAARKAKVQVPRARAESPAEAGPTAARTSRDNQGSQPAPSSRSGSGLSKREGEALDRLLKRMQKRPGFPSFLNNVTEISHKADANNDYCAQQLSEAILKDLALTAKLLRLVNTLFTSRFSGKVHGVNHAVVLLGFDRVRSTALTVSVFKTSGSPAAARNARAKATPPGQHHTELAESSIASLVAGELARSLASRAGVQDPELAMMCGLFRNLGKQLVMEYLPEDYQQVQEVRRAEGLTEDQAARRVLSTSLSKLSYGVAERWQLPRPLQLAVSAMPRLDRPLLEPQERLAALAMLTNELCAVVIEHERTDWPDAVADLLPRYRHLITLKNEEVSNLLGTICKTFEQRYRSIVGPFAGQSRLLRNASPEGFAPHQATPPGPPTDAEQAALTECSDRIGQALAAGGDLSPLVPIALEGLHAMLGTPRLLLLSPSPDRQSLVVTAGIGPEASSLTQSLRFPLARTDTCFPAALRANRPTVIEDTLSPAAMRKLPQNYYEAVGSPALMLLPCHARGYSSVLLMLDAPEAALLPTAERLAATKDLRELFARLLDAISRQA